MNVVVRSAPSPTGRLHVGNIRNALFNWLFARQAGGKFMLRIDDTDTARSTKEFEQGIIEDFAWLGLTHDLFARQSQRIASYTAAAERLKAAGRLYPAFETEDELERKRRIQRARGLPPVYDRAALKLSELDRAHLEGEGRRPHWRFRLDNRHVVFRDLIRGEVDIDTASQSDPVLIREDGSFLYTLPSIVDDIEFGISHVIRGEDHVANTGTQIEIFEALGAAPPEFAHYALIVDAEGGKLSKRFESLSVASLRESGIEPMAILSLLARLGTSDPVEPVSDLEKLAESFSLDKIGRAPARFDPAELEALNARILHATPYDKVKDRLAKLGVGGGEAFWLAVRPNLEKLEDAARWWRILHGPFEGAMVDPPFTARAAEILPQEPWGEATWHAWTEALKAETGRKGKDLFAPLRMALTGLPHGPDMKSLLPLIPRERAVRLLRGEKVG
ncbi:MAG: glutamate--tRNA ligase [Alphaproteobacteria bacterium]